MTALQLNPDQSLSAIVFFTNYLWEQRAARYFYIDPEEFTDYVSYLSGDPATSDDWLAIYAATFGKRICSCHDLLTEEEIFTTMIEMCAWYIYHFGDNYLSILKLLYSMRYCPEEYQVEWQLWQRAVQRTLSGEICTGVDLDD